MTIFGWDLSHYDAPTIGDAIAEGFRFFTHKAGGDANDAELGTWWSNVKGQRGKGAIFGAYWVLRPDTSGTATDKANAFCDRLDSQCPGWGDYPFILQVDCEQWSGNSATVPNKAYIKAFCDRLRVRAPKLMPIVYAPQWVYGNSLTGLGYPLWASSYVSGSGYASALYPGDSSSKWGAYSGQTPAILQFTSSATIAGQTTCDANAYRGTLAELTHLVAPGWDVEDMAGFDKSDLDTMVHTDGVIKAPPGSVNADGSPNTEWGMEGYFLNTYNGVISGRTYANQAATQSASNGSALAALAAQLTTLQNAVNALGTPTVDVEAFAASVAAKVNGVEESEIKDAVKAALREGTGNVA